MRSFLLLAVFAFLTGCATVKPENLEKTNRKEEIVLNEPISTVAYRGLNYRWEEGALPGTYRAERQDSKGTYYFGTGRSVWMTNEAFQKTPRLYVGGIFLPHDGANAPQFFYIFEKEVHTTENINAFILSRIIPSAVSPTTVPGFASASVGADVVGTVIGVQLVDAIIESGVGSIEMFPPIASATARQKIKDGVRASQ